MKALKENIADNGEERATNNFSTVKTSAVRSLMLAKPNPTNVILGLICRLRQMCSGNLTVQMEDTSLSF